MTNGPDAMTAAPWVALFAPWINAIVVAFVGAISSVLLAKLTSLVPKWAQAFFDEKDRATLQQASMTAAGQILAQIEGDLSKVKFETTDPRVQMAAQWILTKGAPQAIDRLAKGVGTPEQTAKVAVGKVMGALGQLQAGATPAPVITTGVVTP